MRIGWVAAACALAVSPLAAQDSTRTAQDSAVRVFLDCPDSFCDFDYYHTEITFVNWVRDRTYAQVHVLVTTQGTGGGQEYTLAFIGQERFAGTADTRGAGAGKESTLAFICQDRLWGPADTLRWNSKAADTPHVVLRGLAGVM